MSTYTAWDRACDLNGLLKAADVLAFELLGNTGDKRDAHSGLVSVLSVARRLSDEVLSDAERAEAKAGSSDA